jgi:hypothetical protein
MFHAEKVGTLTIELQGEHRHAPEIALGDERHLESLFGQREEDGNIEAARAQCLREVVGVHFDAGVLERRKHMHDQENAVAARAGRPGFPYASESLDCASR